MRLLRKNTAVIVTVGPFWDKGDGVTIETALTITNEKITLTADTDDGSAPTNILDNVTGATSGTANDLNYITGNDAGMMQLELAAADTNRLGRMMLSITDAANHVPVTHEFMVVNAALYDAFFATSGGAIPNAVAGASAGLLISGSNSGTTTFGALTVTGATTYTGNVVLSDGLTISAPSTTNRAGLDVTGNGTGAAFKLAAGATGKGIAITTTAGDGLSILPTAGDAIVATANGTSKHGIRATGGTAGTSDGFSAIAGTGGVPIRGDITGNLTGNVSGSAGSVSGAVGSVTGAVGSVTGAVGSVTGNVGGNVTGSIGSVASGGISEASFATTAGSFFPLGIIDQGTAQAATSTTLQLRAAATFATSEPVGAIIEITGGSAGVGQTRSINSYVGSTDTATVDAWTTTPTGTITYKVIAAPPAPVALTSVNVTQWLGTAVSTPTVAGVPNVNTKTWNDLTTVALPLVPATAGRTLVVDAAGLADANAVKVGPTGAGTAQTARDIGASVLLSTGTGTGQLDFTSGVVKANATQWLGGTIPAVTVTGVPLVDLKYVLGTISPAAAGSVRADAVTGAVGSVTGAVGSIAGGGIAEASFATTAGSFVPLGIIDQGTAQAATSTTLQLRAAATFADTEPVGSVIQITGGSAGVGQSRTITGYVGSTDTATVDAWTTTPTGTITYKVWASPPQPVSVPAVNVTQWLGTAVSTPTVAGVPNVNAKTWNDLTTVALPLVPTTAGRTLDVTATGEAGIDWANVGAPTTTLNLSGTTIATTQKVDIETIKTQAVTAGAGVTFPSSIASPTNITAGTIATVTNLTNAPTAGDLTATMKTSVQTAADAAVTANASVAAIKAYADRTVGRGTVSATSPSTTSFTASAMSPAGAVADQFKGRIILFDNATTTAGLRGQWTEITANTSDALPVFTYNTLTTAPVSGDTFSIV